VTKAAPLLADGLDAALRVLAPPPADRDAVRRELARLVADYRRRRDLWRAAPPLAELRGRLARIAALAADLRDVLDDTDAWTCEAVGVSGCLAAPGLERAINGQLAGAADAAEHGALTALERLAAASAGWTGRRCASAAFLDGSPPRWRLCRALADVLGPGRLARLGDLTLAVLIAAGDPAPEVGLPDVVKSVRASLRAGDQFRPRAAGCPPDARRSRDRIEREGDEGGARGE
jgi:hypothetical protein